MSRSEIIEKIRPLPAKEKRELIRQIWAEFGEELGPVDPNLTPEQMAELDRRAADALKHPERCRPIEAVVADLERRFRNR